MCRVSDEMSRPKFVPASARADSRRCAAIHPRQTDSKDASPARQISHIDRAVIQLMARCAIGRPSPKPLRFLLCCSNGLKRSFGVAEDVSLEGLSDRRRRPYRQANRLSFQVETLILGLKREHPSWGAPKIRENLRRRFSDMRPPAISTVHAVLDRNGLVRATVASVTTTLRAPRCPLRARGAAAPGEETNYFTGRGSGNDPAAALAARRILVVDDNRDAAESLAILLRILGADVCTATMVPMRSKLSRVTGRPRSFWISACRASTDSKSPAGHADSLQDEMSHWSR